MLGTSASEKGITLFFLETSVQTYRRSDDHARKYTGIGKKYNYLTALPLLLY